MSFHSNLILVRKIIGYLDEEPGCCYGFTMRWLEAHFLNEISIFKNRIKLIQSFYEDQALLYRLPKMIKFKQGQELTEAEYHYLEVLAFLDSISIFQRPHCISPLPNESFRSIPNIEWISQLASSDEIARQGGLTQCFSMTRSYTKFELSTFLTHLTELLIKEPYLNEQIIAFTLSNHNHICGLVFNKKIGWELMDINQYPSKVCSPFQLNLLSNYLMKALAQPNYNNTVVFNLTFIKPKQQDIPTSFLKKLTQFRLRFPILKHEALRQNCQGVDIAQLAALYNDDTSLKELSQLGLELNLNLALCIAAQNGHLNALHEIVQYSLKQNEAFFKQSLAIHAAIKSNRITTVRYLLNQNIDINYGHPIIGTPLTTAILFGNVDIVELLLSYHANPLKQNLINPQKLSIWVSAEVLKRIQLHCQNEPLSLSELALSRILNNKSIVSLLKAHGKPKEPIYQLGVFIIEKPDSVSKRVFSMMKHLYHYALEHPTHNLLISCKLIVDFLELRLNQDDVQIVAQVFIQTQDPEARLLSFILDFISHHATPSLEKITVAGPVRG